MTVCFFFLFFCFGFCFVLKCWKLVKNRVCFCLSWSVCVCFYAKLLYFSVYFVTFKNEQPSLLQLQLPSSCVSQSAIFSLIVVCVLYILLLLIWNAFKNPWIYSLFSFLLSCCKDQQGETVLLHSLIQNSLQFLHYKFCLCWLDLPWTLRPHPS